MSVLVQRPQQTPGVVSLPRSSRHHHNHPQASATSSPTPNKSHSRQNMQRNGGNSNKRGQQRSVVPASPSPAPAAATTPNKKRSNRKKDDSDLPFPSAPDSFSVLPPPVDATNSAPTLTMMNSTPATPPRKQRSAPTTPVPSNVSPAPRKAHTQPKVPTLNGASGGPVTLPNTNWQQAALLAKSRPSAEPVVSNTTAFARSILGSESTPASPYPAYASKVHLPYSPTMPAFPTYYSPVPKRPGHARAPSVPVFANDAPFPAANFNTALSHARRPSASNVSLSSSLPQQTGIHARIAGDRRERTLTGGQQKFASASFQRAPEAIFGLPRPAFGSTPSSRENSGSSSSEEEIVDLTDESYDEEDILLI